MKTIPWTYHTNHFVCSYSGGISHETKHLLNCWASFHILQSPYCISSTCKGTLVNRPKNHLSDICNQPVFGIAFIKCLFIAMLFSLPRGIVGCQSLCWEAVCFSAGKQQVVQVEVRTISDIEKDYSLVRTKISLLRVDPSVATQIYSEFQAWMTNSWASLCQNIVG